MVAAMAEQQTKCNHGPTWVLYVLLPLLGFSFYIWGVHAGRAEHASAAVPPPGKCFAQGQQAASACYAPDRQVRVVCTDAEGCGSIRLETVEEFKRPGEKQ